MLRKELGKPNLLMFLYHKTETYFLIWFLRCLNFAMKDTFTVITGASQGLGKAFAEELARDKKNLLLVSLPDEELPRLCKHFQKEYGIQAEFYETDLGKKENILGLATWINKNFDIDTLINNAGIGGTKKFDEVSASYIENMICLNVMATSILTHQLLPNLKSQKRSYVLNICSLAAFSPMAYKTVYPASKAFIYSFSRSLNEELKNTNITVSVVSPGPMKTNGNTTKRINKQGIFTKMALQEPSAVAKYSIEKMRKGKAVIVPNRLSWLVINFFPSWIMIPIMTKKFKKELNVQK